MKIKLRIYLAAIGMWLVFLTLAFSLGALRQLVLNPVLGEHISHVVGTLVVVVVFLAFMVPFVRRVRRRGASTSDLWLTGFLWLVMTLSFEFLFFNFVANKPWDEILAEYNLAKGRIWILVLAATFFGPAAIHAVLASGDNNRKPSV